MKTHTGAAKRFKITSTGKIMFRGVGVRHLLSKKSSSHKRRKGRFFCLNSGEKHFFKRLLPYVW